MLECVNSLVLSHVKLSRIVKFVYMCAIYLRVKNSTW